MGMAGHERTLMLGNCLFRKIATVGVLGANRFWVGRDTEDPSPLDAMGDRCVQV
jgi:hypothetical protein